MQLEDYQKLVLQQIKVFGEEDYATQFHKDLSPAGWHLGHCVYTEAYWIREQWLSLETLDPSLQHLFVPELSSKPERGERIAPYQQLFEWSQYVQDQDRELISKNNGQKTDDRLMQKQFLLHFLQQHYAQHYETLLMIRAQRELRSAYNFEADYSMQPEKLNHDYIEIDTGEYETGSCVSWHYDNEKPAFKLHSDCFLISKNPVSNAEYLSFMEDGGYDNQAYWSDAGWQWKNRYHLHHPEYWQTIEDNEWWLMTPTGPEALVGGHAVHGISWHEARAYASWAQARLPHEYEWEFARKTGKLKCTGQSWEWCDNRFHPYPGFKPFPYQGYSVPYFDGQHYVLRGGSRYTLEIIKRPTFRNFYQADKRHIFAGLRLAKDIY